MNRLSIILLLVMIITGGCATAQYTPPKVTISTEKIRNESGEFFVHKVQQRETLFSISKAYNINVNSLINDNPKASEGLKTGDILFIRIGAPPVPEEEISVQEDIVEKSLPEKRKRFIPGRDYVHKISLILPVNSRNLNEQNPVSNFIDFYHGFLMAVNDAKDSGMSINLEVIDNKEYQNSYQIVATGKLNNSELIVGPVFASEIEGILDFAGERDIPVISPMDPAAEKYISGNRFFYQLPVTAEEQQRTLLKSIPYGSQITLFYEKGGRDAEMLQLTRSILNESGIAFKEFSYALLEGRLVRDQITNLLSTNNDNSVIIISESEAFVSDILRNLNLISTRSGYKITLFGLPRWRNFESVDIDYYHSMNLHLALQYFVDYSSEGVKRFLSRYRALFGTEPTPYAFQAYDTGKYFLDILKNEGPSFADNIDEYKSTRLLQSDLRFKRRDNTMGVINFGVRIIVFRPDYSIDLLAPVR